MCHIVNMLGKIMKKFLLKRARHKRTTTTTHINLTKDDQQIDMDQSMYTSMIVSVLYLLASHRDITFLVGVCLCYRENPKVIHLTQVKKS